MARSINEIIVTKETLTDDANVVIGVKITLTCGNGIYVVVNSNGDIDNDWVRTTDYTAEKTYEENVTETITVTKGLTSQGTEEEITFSVTEIGDPEEVSYAYCGSKCKHPVYTKDYIDEMIFKKGNVIYYGTEAPNDSWGNDGDIYLRYSE